jgi:hypothetical protein
MQASDVERDRAAETLGAHYVAGRLTLAEFTERVEKVLRAQSVADLDALTADLGTVPPLPAPPRRRRRPFSPGNLPFAVRFRTSETPKTVMNAAMRTVVPRLLAQGYVIEIERPRLMLVAKTYRPAWTVAAAVFVFPFGLLALQHKKRSHVMIAVEGGGGRETTVEVAGTAPLRLRRDVHLLTAR